MTEKELRKLKRVELLDMLIEQGKLVDAQALEIASLRDQCSDLQKQLEDHKVSIEKTGSLAEASVKIAGLMEAAEKAARIYLENLKERSGSDIPVEEALAANDPIGKETAGIDRKEDEGIAVEDTAENSTESGDAK